MSLLSVCLGKLSWDLGLKSNRKDWGSPGKNPRPLVYYHTTAASHSRQSFHEMGIWFLTRVCTPLCFHRYMSRFIRKLDFCICETKTQISCAVTAHLISTFVFAIQIVQSLYYLNPKFQASGYLLWLYSLVCVRSGRTPRRPVFSQRGSYCSCCCWESSSVNNKLMSSQSVTSIMVTYPYKSDPSFPPNI